MAGSRAPRARSWLRAIGIAARIFGYATWFGLGWLGLVVRLAPRARRKAWFGRCVLELFRGLGATYIKVGQLMSTRPDLLPEHVTGALERLQDDVGPFPFERVVRTIEEDFRRPLGALFAEVAPVPLASASVAQVHRARLHDGRIVAIKVRRPEVKELCAFDLAVMKRVARWLGKLPPLRGLAPESAAAEFARAIAAQLDLRIEAANNVRFRTNFAGQNEVLFPELVPALCSERVLTMTFVEGTKILSVGQTRADPKQIARIGLRALLKMIFTDGFVHADLHPGNIFVTPEGKVALLDLGLVGELDPASRKIFGRFFAAWAQKDGDTMAHLMYALAEDGNKDASPFALSDDPRFQRFRAAVIEFVGRYWGRKVGEVQLGNVLMDMLAILRRHRIRMAPTFTIVNIAIAITEGIAKQLDPDLDLIAEALPYFLQHPVDRAQA